MLPDGVIPIPIIQREPNIGNRIINLAALLGYLLKFIDPDLESPDGQEVKLGKRVDANQHLFSDYKSVFFALGVRNYFVHPEDQDRVYSDAEKTRAANHLLLAINEICKHQKVPKDIISEVKRDPITSQNKEDNHQILVHQKESRNKDRSFGGLGYVAVLVIVVTLFISLISSNNETTDMQPIPGHPQGELTWKTHNNANFGFIIDYPNGWTISEEQKENIFRTYFKLPSSYVSIMLDAGVEVTERSPTDWWQKFDRQLKRAYGDRYQGISIKKSTWGGKDAAAWLFTLERKDEPNLKKLDIGTFHNGKGYALLFATLEGDFDSWYTTFDHIAKSFRFTGSEVVNVPSQPQVGLGTSQLPSPRDQTSDVEKIKAIIADWKHAWESRNFDRYINFYDRSFSKYAPNFPGLNKRKDYSQWLDATQNAFHNQSKNQFQIHNLNAVVSDDRAQATFDQEGQIDQRSYRGKDTIDFKKINGTWKFVRENWVLDDTHLPTRQWMDEYCYYGEWKENISNQLRWNIWLEKGILKIKRNDGLVFGSFDPSSDLWVGHLKWGNGTSWNNVILYKANSDCTEIKTNQQWWYKR